MVKSIEAVPLGHPMNTTPIDQSPINLWKVSEQREALRQTAALCQQALAAPGGVAFDGGTFRVDPDSPGPPHGILAVTGKLDEAAEVIAVQLALARGPAESRVGWQAFYAPLAQLKDKIHLLPPQREADGRLTLAVELRVKATPMTMSRASAFLDELKQLEALGRALQAELPGVQTDPDLAKTYQSFSELLEPVPALSDGEAAAVSEVLAWVRTNDALLHGTGSLALVAQSPITLGLVLSAWARVAGETGSSLGQLLVPAINAKGLLELSRKAPGALVVPANALSLSASPYELGHEMQALLAALAEVRPVIFTGHLEQLQSVFALGQGAVHDPLLPAVRRVPEVGLESLVRFAVGKAGRRVGGLPPRAASELREQVLAALQELNPAEQRRLLPAVARQTVQDWAVGRPLAHGYVSQLSGLSETLGGLSSRPRAVRPAEVQARYTRVLSDPELLPYLQKELLAQDRALAELTARLTMEALTRPAHQPLRYCAQGTPGTGKSESALLLAQRLGIPYVNIDAPSLGDYHTAKSQLLGSGRGIVMSHKPGRLEEIAKHHTGVLVEVSDLDHVRASERALLADLFLQVLDHGVATATTGPSFSMAKVIFAFTLNLPAGRDETLRRPFGFTPDLAPPEVLGEVIKELKQLLSSAFLSRVGTPILFEPLSGAALAAILERAIRQAVLTAAERLGWPGPAVVLEAGLGQKLLAAFNRHLNAFGARALFEQGRSLAAQAMVAWRQQRPRGATTLTVALAADGRLIIHSELGGEYD